MIIASKLGDQCDRSFIYDDFKEKDISMRKRNKRRVQYNHPYLQEPSWLIHCT